MRWRLADYPKNTMPVGPETSGAGAEEDRQQRKFDEMKAKVAAKKIEDRGVNY